MTGLAGCTGDGSDGDGGSSDGGDGGGDGDGDDGGGATDGGSDGSDGEYSVGFQVGGLENTWFTSLAQASQWYAQDNGIDLNIGDGELNPTTQVEVAQNLINSNIDALIVNPFDSEAMVDPVEEATEQGIPTFSVDSVALTSDLKMYTAFGNYSAGQRAAKNAVDRLEERYGEKRGRVVEVMIEQSAKLGVDRRRGTEDELAKYDDVELAGEIITDNTRQDASEKVFNFLQQDSDIDGFVCHAVTVSNGTLNALERADMKQPSGEEGHKIISQIDAGPSTLEAMREGFISVAIDQPVHFYGPITLHYIKEFLDAGEDESVLPSIGETVEGDAVPLSSPTAEEATGGDIWADPIWAPAEVEEVEGEEDISWFHTNSAKVTQENVDAPYLWGNWIRDVA